MAKLKINKNIKILKSGEISINKKTLRNSNIHDLLKYLMRNKKNEAEPLYISKFIKILANSNVPQSFIKNRKQLQVFKRLKTMKKQPFFDESDLSNTSFSSPPPKKRKRENIWISADN